MLLKLLIILLYVNGNHADGELKVMTCPPAMGFSGLDMLQSSEIHDVILAAMGLKISVNMMWTGLNIMSPFDLDLTTAIIVHVRGILSLSKLEGLNVFPLNETRTQESLDQLVTEVSEENVYDINFFNHLTGILAYQKAFDNEDVQFAEPINLLKPTEYLSHNDFLTEIGYMIKVSENLDKIMNTSRLLIFRMTLDRISRVSSYEVLDEAKQITTLAINKLLTAGQRITDSLLFVVITDNYLRSSHRTFSSNVERNPFENAIMDLDNPIVFNITLWFMLAFVLALAAVCSAIMNIDPGKDSVIYRVTPLGGSTKKSV